MVNQARADLGAALHRVRAPHSGACSICGQHYSFQATVAPTGPRAYAHIRCVLNQSQPSTGATTGGTPKPR